MEKGEKEEKIGKGKQGKSERDRETERQTQTHRQTDRESKKKGPYFPSPANKGQTSTSHNHTTHVNAVLCCDAHEIRL